MIEQILSYLITAIGLLGFWLAGKKVWWCWWVNVANQVMWTIFAVGTGYYAFLFGTAFYFFVFTKNGIQWTREHLEQRRQDVFDSLESTASNEPIITMRFDGSQFTGAVDEVKRMLPEISFPEFSEIDEYKSEYVQIEGQEAFVGKNGHICHAADLPNLEHTFSCPTGEHPMGWQHQPSHHKTCKICR